MFIELERRVYLDLFPFIFMAIALVGTILSVVALIIGRKAKNSYKSLVMGLSVFTMLLFCGAVVNGIIGCVVKYYIHHHPCSWVCLGLGSGAALFGVIAFVVQILTKNIVSEDNEDRIVSGVDFEKDSNECLFYQEFSQGAIEVKDGYITYYKNLFPFTKCKKGRTASTIFINDIQHITYKGCGWFHGVFAFTFKHANKPLVIWFSKYFVWRAKKLNPKMTPIYEYIKMQVIKNNK